MKRLALLISLIALAVVPATALAGKIRHSGGIAGDTEAEVYLTLTKKGGKITKLSKFRALNLFFRCDGQPYRGNVIQLNPTRVSRKGTFRERLKNADGSVLRISGKVKARGRKVVGKVKSNEFRSGGLTCKAPEQGFVTTRR